MLIKLEMKKIIDSKNKKELIEAYNKIKIKALKLKELSLRQYLYFKFIIDKMRY
jgi:hypothetical protein